MCNGQVATIARPYVIICNRHEGTYPGAVLFWGHRTEDHEKRSYGGYTSDFERCERYTRKEVERYTIVGEDISVEGWRSFGDVAIDVALLPEIGFKLVAVWMQG